MIDLYPFQNSIVTEARQAFSDGFFSPTVVAPTGSGKTIMFAYIALNAMQRGNRVLILVHRREILQQTLEKLFSFGVQAGQIASGKPMTRDMIQVAMVGTIVRRLDKFKKDRFDLIICDEGHHAVSPTWLKILAYFHKTPRMLFTATPERADGAGLIDVSDKMIMGPTISELVNDGYLAYPVMYRPPQEVIENYHMKRGDFDKEEQVNVMSRRQIVGDVIGHYKKHLDHQPVVCFCVSIDHCHMMTESFIAAGYKARTVWGNMPDKDRKSAIYGLADGSVEVVTSCDVISEGVDVPVMAGCILLRRTVSLALYLQQVGRALRKHEGKNHAIILDHAGNYYLHGHVLADRDWSLEHGKRNHKKDKNPEITSCPKCFGVWPGKPKVCPGYLNGEKCGFVFDDKKEIAGQQRKPPEQIAGELIAALPDGVDPAKVKELTDDIMLMQRMPAATRKKYFLKKAYELQDKGEIAALTKAIGYKPGWTYHVWKNILGNR